MVYRIYSIRRRGIYSFQAVGGGRYLLEGGIYSHNNYVAYRLLATLIRPRKVL